MSALLSWPLLAVACVGAAGCVVAQDLGGDGPPTQPVATTSSTAEGAGLVLDPDQAMPRTQACPLAEPEPWSACPVDHTAPCVYPFSDGVRSAVCACVLAGEGEGRWTCVATVLHVLSATRSLEGSLCSGSFQIARTCQGSECALCRGSVSCTVRCHCDETEKVACE